MRGVQGQGRHVRDVQGQGCHVRGMQGQGCHVRGMQGQGWHVRGISLASGRQPNGEGGDEAGPLPRAMQQQQQGRLARRPVQVLLVQALVHQQTTELEKC